MSQWVPVLVRLEDYAEIAALVAEREGSRTDSPKEVITSPAIPAAPASDPRDAELATHSPWSVEDLRALAAGTSETAKRWTLAMDACSVAVGSGHHWLTTTQVAERTGMTINEWRDAARKITRHLRANFPNVPVDANGDHLWPLLAKNTPGSQEVSWAISAEQAKRWRRVRGNA